MEFTKKENFFVSGKDIRNAGYKTEELLPCPFCGNKIILTCGRKNETSGNIVYSVFCDNAFECGASISTCLGGEETAEKARETVVNAWNKRMPVVATPGVSKRPCIVCGKMHFHVPPTCSIKCNDRYLESTLYHENVYCFECEIEMPVKVTDGIPSCKNCGLRHLNDRNS